MSTNTDSENNDAQSRSKEGRQAGIRNWSEAETDILLDIVAEIRPSGRKQWERVALSMKKASFIEPRWPVFGASTNWPMLKSPLEVQRSHA